MYADGGVLGIDTPYGESGGMFYMYKAKEMDLRGLDMSKMRNAKKMFYSCESLVNLDLSGVSMHSINNTEWMFADCSKLIALDLSDANFDYIESAKHMFYKCCSLTTLDLTGMNMSRVHNTDYMLYTLTGSLKDVYVRNYYDMDRLQDSYYRSPNPTYHFCS